MDLNKFDNESTSIISATEVSIWFLATTFGQWYLKIINRFKERQINT